MRESRRYEESVMQKEKNPYFRIAVLDVIESDQKLSLEEKQKRSNMVMQCRNSDELLKFMDNYDYGDAEVREKLNNLNKIGEIYGKVVAAEEILIQNGLNPNRLPRKPDKEKLYRLANSLGISNEEFTQLINQRLLNES